MYVQEKENVYFVKIILEESASHCLGVLTWPLKKWEPLKKLLTMSKSVFFMLKMGLIIIISQKILIS